jgi:PAS domain S-box-containing protein
MSPRDIVPAEIQQQVMPDIIRRLRQEGHATFESIHKRKDGTTYPVEVSTHTFRYKGMDVDLSICRDITGRRQAEQVLRESEERYRALVDHALDPILIFDFTGTILFANNAAAALGDAPDPASFLGRNVMEFIAPESREAVRADFASVREGNDAYLTQYKVITATGRELWVESMGKRIRYNGQWADIVTLRDITERRNAEDALRLANRKLTLLSGITRHDIRNQLLSLNAYLALSQDNVADPEKMAGFVRVEREITRTIEQQVLFSREYEMLGVNAPEWLEIRTITREASARMDLTGIALDLSRLQDVEVYADGLFRNAIQNLIDNSLRHGGESLHAIRFASGETGRGLVITCEDDGAGVAPDDKRMIFERGFGRNTGFGLFFIREILAITGITITENGEQGRGARFEILVPRGGYRFRKAGDGDT